MVTEEKITDMVLARYRLGTVMIWLGVLTWLPFIMLRIAGERPSLFLFLPIHLIGVVGGSRLRSWARKEMSVPIVKKSLLQILGHGSIFVGVLVWVPYFYLKAIVHQPVDVMNYLPYHLTGVLGGIVLLAINYFISQRMRRNSVQAQGSSFLFQSRIFLKVMIPEMMPDRLMMTKIVERADGNPFFIDEFAPLITHHFYGQEADNIIFK